MQRAALPRGLGRRAAGLPLLCAIWLALQVAGQAADCSCDCCVSVDRLPADIHVTNEGDVSEHVCAATGQSGQCARECLVANSHDAIDYVRFCMFDCRPVEPAHGSACFLAIDPLVGEKLDRGGLPIVSSGPEVPKMVPAQVPSSGSAGEPEAVAAPAAPAAPWEAKVAQQSAREAQKAQAAMNSEMDQRVVYWDYRNLVSERLRAEAGADMAHSAATGEAIRLKDAALDRKNARLKQVQEALKELPTGLDEAVATVADDAAVAKEDAAAVKLAVRAAKASVSRALRGTRVKAINAIQAVAVPLSIEEAEAYARWAHWDKPEMYGRVLANRAAMPFVVAGDSSAAAAAATSQFMRWERPLVPP